MEQKNSKKGDSAIWHGLGQLGNNIMKKTSENKAGDKKSYEKELQKIRQEQLEYENISSYKNNQKEKNGIFSIKLNAQKNQQSPDKDKSYHLTDEEKRKKDKYVEETDHVKKEQSDFENISNCLQDEEMGEFEELTKEFTDICQKQMDYKDNSDFEIIDEEKESKYLKEIKCVKQAQKNYSDIIEGSKDVESSSIEECSAELERARQEQTGYEDKSENLAKDKAGNSSEKNVTAFEETGQYNGSSIGAVLNDTFDKVPYEYALRILSKYRIKYLDSPKTSKLYIFNGMIWEPLRDAEDMASIVYKEMTVEEKRTQENIEGFCRKVASFIKFECKERNESGKERFLNSDFKAIENRIVFKNYVYDIITGETMPHDGHLPYYIGIDSDYMEEDVDTPMYDKLKFDATGGDKESMDMFDLMLGYLMIPNRSGKCYFVMADAKDSGKSIFGHFIESIYMGGRVKTINLEHLSGRFSMADADCVTLLSGLEASMDRLTLPVAAQIKRITGENKIRVEAKYRGEQDVAIRFKLILATNGAMLLPRNMSDNAFYRRTIIIPFIKSMPPDQIIADMPELLQEEKSAILSKAARRIGSIAEPDGGIQFPESELSLKMKKTWIGSTDYESLFIREKLRFTAREEDAIPKEDIYKQYQIYFEEVTGYSTNAAMPTKNELMQRIMESYPGVSARKLRRGSMENVGEVKLRPCMTCLAWSKSAEQSENAQLKINPVIG